jgi:TonB family protein
MMVGGNVQAAKLIKRVQPAYPDKARQEYVSGTVKIHAVIGKDGQIAAILGVQGTCSLAESAVNAVRQWHYSATLFNSHAIEIDIEIDVILSLSR